MYVSSRMTHLLEKAAQCYVAGGNPFHHQWLTDNDVTIAECERLAELISAVLRGFVQSTDKAQAEILVLSAAGRQLRAELVRALIEQRDVIQRPESVDQH